VLRGTQDHWNTGTAVSSFARIMVLCCPF